MLLALLGEHLATIEHLLLLSANGVSWRLMNSLRKTYSTFTCLDIQCIERRKALQKLCRRRKFRFSSSRGWPTTIV